MKLIAKLISFLLTISSIFLLSACGVPTSKTTLKVTNSMAVGNTTYKGGLVFYGRSAGGKFFSAPIAYSAGSANNTAEIVLDKGVWTFAAVGWSHTNTNPDPLQGTSECAVTTVNLDADNKTVVLDLDSSKCNNDEFGGAGAYNAANGGFGITTLITCGTLYKNSSTETPLDPLNPTNNDPTYCSSGTDITPDLKLWAKSARIKIPVIKPGQPPLQSSDLSFCQVLEQGKTDPIIPSPGAETINSMLKRLPPKGVPFIIELHDNGSCTSPIKKYEFREGLTFPYPNFDYEFYNSNLYLLTTISQRGQSSLMDSLPSFECSSTLPCSAIPESTSQRFIQSSTPFYLADKSVVVDCSNLSSITISGGTSTLSSPNSPVRCETRDDRLYFKLSNNDLSSLSCTTSCTLEFTFTKSGYTPVSIGRSIELQATNISALAAYNLLLSTVGHQDIKTSLPIGEQLNGLNSLDFFHEGDQDDSHYGLLSNIREFFGPQIAGGFFSNLTTSASLTDAETNIVLWEDGVQKSINLKIESNDDDVPTYLVADEGAYGVGTNTHSEFTHQLTVSKIIGGVYVPMTILKWVYGEKIGLLEEKNTKNEDGKSKTHRRILAWNTNSINHHRLENYEYESENLVSSPTTQTKVRTRFTRAEKAGSDDKARIESFNYQSNLEGSNHYQNANKEFIYLNSNFINYSREDAWAQKGSGDPDFFGREGINLVISDKSMNHKAASGLSPNKSHLINAWPECTTFDSSLNSCTTWSIKILLKSSTSKFFQISSLSSSDEPKIKVSVNNGGHASIAWSINTGSTSDLYAMVWNDSTQTWTSAQTSGTFNVSTPSLNIASITGLVSFATSLSPKISFDLIDENPNSSSTSNKTIFYAEKSTDWSIKMKAFSSSTPSTIYSGSTNVPAAPLFLNVTKNDTSVYLISFLYELSGEKLKSFKWNGSNTSNVNEVSSPGLGFSPKAIYSIPDSTMKQVLYFQPDDPSSNQMKKIVYTIEGANGSHSSPPQSLSNRGFNKTISNYCFPQVLDTSNPTTFNIPHDFDSCAAPASSYAPAIQSTVLIDHDDDEDSADIDAGFKHDIQSLNPETFKYLFTIP
jgi:hypothetical protein